MDFFILREYLDVEKEKQEQRKPRKLLYRVDHIIDEVDEKELRYYRTHLRHL